MRDDALLKAELFLGQETISDLPQMPAEVFRISLQLPESVSAAVALSQAEEIVVVVPLGLWITPEAP